MQDEMTSIAIPAGLYRRIEEMLPRLGQASAEAFVVHAVRTALSAAEAAVASAPGDEAAIVERLRRLGYID
ncbi:MAG: hypothetical protein QN178_06220 [Armatimonadota bacterium]|nr:hypothetical protein [Armatimonadota bacterium]